MSPTKIRRILLGEDELALRAALDQRSRDDAGGESRTRTLSDELVIDELLLIHDDGESDPPPLDEVYPRR